MTGDGLAADPNLDALVEEIGDPDTPADILVWHLDVVIVKADGGFPSYLAPLLFGAQLS